MKHKLDSRPQRCEFPDNLTFEKVMTMWHRKTKRVKRKDRLYRKTIYKEMRRKQFNNLDWTEVELSHNAGFVNWLVVTKARLEDKY